MHIAFFHESHRQDLNPQPTDYKSVALPIELRWLNPLYCQRRVTKRRAFPHFFRQGRVPVTAPPNTTSRGLHPLNPFAFGLTVLPIKIRALFRIVKRLGAFRSYALYLYSAERLSGDLRRNRGRSQLYTTLKEIRQVELCFQLKLGKSVRRSVDHILELHIWEPLKL